MFPMSVNLQSPLSISGLRAFIAGQNRVLGGSEVLSDFD
jgi:hypothetical protein